MLEQYDFEIAKLLAMNGVSTNGGPGMLASEDEREAQWKVVRALRAQIEGILENAT